MKKINFKQTEIGEIPKDWNLVELGELCEVKSGKRLPKGCFLVDYKTQHPYIRVRDLSQMSVKTDDLLYLDDKTHEKISKYIITENDVYISIVATIGLVGLVPEAIGGANLTENCARLTSLKSINKEFLAFYLNTKNGQDQIRSLTVGTTQAKLALYRIKKIKVPLPSLFEQEEIGKIVQSLNSKVNLNHQMNKTLESIAQATFKHWFVDFEFPGEHGKPYKSSGGKMVDSELGDIPQGCAVKEISGCGKIICGKTPPTADKENYGDDIFFITIPDMRGQAFVIKTERKLSKRGASLQENKELPPLAICVSCIATPGLVSITSDISHTNQQINSIVCKKDVSPYFMYYTMLDKSEEIKTMGLGGTATLNLNTGNFARIKVIIPDHVTMDAFHKKVAPIMSRLLSNLQENIKLCDIRDSLLPRLMSGKIRVGVL